MISPERLSNLRQKLFPGRFSGMSGKMAAIVGYILGVRWTDPEIEEIHLTSDGMMLAQHRGDIGANEFLGSREDLMNNWRRLLRAADLTKQERTDAHTLFVSKVTKHGGAIMRPRENPKRKCGCEAGKHACDLHRGGGIIRAHRNRMRRHFHVKKVDGGFRVVASKRENPRRARRIHRISAPKYRCPHGCGFRGMPESGPHLRWKEGGAYRCPKCRGRGSGEDWGMWGSSARRNPYDFGPMSLVKFKASFLKRVGWLTNVPKDLYVISTSSLSGRRMVKVRLPNGLAMTVGEDDVMPVGKPDYSDNPSRRCNPDWTLTQQEYRNLKSRLTRARNQGPAAVERECRHASEVFHDKGWPDDWARWRGALEDAGQRLSMEGNHREAQRLYALANSLFTG